MLFSTLVQSAMSYWLGKQLVLLLRGFRPREETEQTEDSLGPVWLDYPASLALVAMIAVCVCAIILWSESWPFAFSSLLGILGK